MGPTRGHDLHREGVFGHQGLVGPPQGRHPAAAWTGVCEHIINVTQREDLNQRQEDNHGVTPSA